MSALTSLYIQVKTVEDMSNYKNTIPNLEFLNGKGI
jgi:hypothetical protein